MSTPRIDGELIALLEHISAGLVEVGDSGTDGSCVIDTELLDDPAHVVFRHEWADTDGQVYETTVAAGAMREARVEGYSVHVQDTSGEDILITLQELTWRYAPLTRKLGAADEDADGWVKGVVTVELSDMIDNDGEQFLDLLEELLLESGVLSDTTYEVVGFHDETTLLLEVSGQRTGDEDDDV